MDSEKGYIAAAHARQFPAPLQREVALAGRSNVGKSSLVNALCKRKNLARTSKTPGKTKMVFFYEADRGDVVYVDLPGYGYAQASRAAVSSLSRVTDDYFRSGRPVELVLLLIDIRRGFTDLDLQMLESLCHFDIPWQTVLTKADKLPRHAVVEAEREAMRVIETYAGRYGQRALPPISVAAGVRPGDAAVQWLQKKIFEIIAE